MKKSIFFLLAALFLFINCLPSSIVFADDSGYTSSQYADIGTIMLTSLIQSGEASELDFSDYTESDGLDFLISLGELAVTGDPTGLIDQGLTWLGGELSDAYESFIWDIREWEHSIAPNLYNLWYNGGKYQIDYLSTPDNVSRPLTNLLRNPNNTPTPSPDPDFSFLENSKKLLFWNSNGVNYGFGTNYLDFVQFGNIFTSITNGYDNRQTTPTFNSLYVSYYCPNGAVHVNQNTNQYIVFPLSSILRIDFSTTTFNAVYSGATFLSDYLSGYTGYNNTYIQCANLGAYPNQLFWNYKQFSTSYPTFRTDFDSLSVAINYFYDYFANFSLYVDGELWVDAGSPTYPIVIPDMLTVLNDQPAKYTFSEPTYLDLTNLKTLITNAINNSDVLTWQDIDDYFLDINGQQAFPVVQIVRNDYDQMYLEQYPYPAKLIGMQQPLTFNEHLLDNYYGQYLTPMVDVASNAVDVLPGEIKWVLSIGAILMIFAVIINRLLE